MVGLLIGEMEREKVETVIDGVDEPELLGEGVDSAESAVDQSLRAIGQLIVDVGSRHDRPGTTGEILLVEALVDSALAACESLPYGPFHSKSSGRGMFDRSATDQTPRKHRRISSFSRNPPARGGKPRLFKD